MISKVISGQTFTRLCEYLCKDQNRALVVTSEGVRDYHYGLMAQDFERQRAMNRNIKSPVLHMILSYYPGEQISDEQLAKIGKEYLVLHGIKNTQFAIIKHTDRNHLHTHIIVNRVDNNGHTIKDNWIGYKGKKIAQALTLKYELKQVEKKTLELTQLEQRNTYEVNRFKIYQIIHEILPKCLDLDQLRRGLEMHHIEMLYKFKGSTNKIEGVSFQMGDFKYKGSEIDRQFSYLNLKKAVIRNSVSQQLKIRPGSLMENRLKSYGKMQQNSQWQGTGPMEELMRPEQSNDYVPPELKKKKKRLRL